MRLSKTVRPLKSTISAFQRGKSAYLPHDGDASMRLKTSIRPATARAKSMPNVKLDSSSPEGARPASALNLLKSVASSKLGEGDSRSLGGTLLAVKDPNVWRQHIAKAKRTAIGECLKTPSFISSFPDPLLYHTAYIGSAAMFQVMAKVAPRRTFQDDILSFLVRDGFGEDFQRVAETMEQYEEGRSNACAALGAIEAAKAAEASTMESQQTFTVKSPPPLKPRISSARNAPKSLYQPSPPTSARHGTSNGKRPATSMSSPQALGAGEHSLHLQSSSLRASNQARSRPQDFRMSRHQIQKSRGPILQVRPVCSPLSKAWKK